MSEEVLVASPEVFFVFAGIAIASALLVVLKKNPVSAALNLVLVFFCFAAIFAMLSAHFLAAIQILVYAGAVMVLVVFVIMLLGADVPSLDMKSLSIGARITAASLFAILVVGFAFLFLQMDFSNLPVKGQTLAAVEQAGGNTLVISELIFSKFVLPFELMAILLFAAMVGSVAIAMRKKDSHGGDSK